MVTTDYDSGEFTWVQNNQTLITTSYCKTVLQPIVVRETACLWDCNQRNDVIPLVPVGNCCLIYGPWQYFLCHKKFSCATQRRPGRVVSIQGKAQEFDTRGGALPPESCMRFRSANKRSRLFQYCKIIIFAPTTVHWMPKYRHRKNNRMSHFNKCPKTTTFLHSGGHRKYNKLAQAEL